MKVDEAWVLKSPGGHLIAETAVTDRRAATVKVFEYFSKIEPGFAEKYWKRWEAAQRAVRARGWRVVKARLVAA